MFKRSRYGIPFFFVYREDMKYTFHHTHPYGYKNNGDSQGIHEIAEIIHWLVRKYRR